MAGPPECSQLSSTGISASSSRRTSNSNAAQPTGVSGNKGRSIRVADVPVSRWVSLTTMSPTNASLIRTRTSRSVMGISSGITRESLTPEGLLSGIAKPGVRQKDGRSKGVGVGVAVWPNANVGPSRAPITTNRRASLQQRFILSHLAISNRPPAWMKPSSSLHKSRNNHAYHSAYSPIPEAAGCDHCRATYGVCLVGRSSTFSSFDRSAKRRELLGPFGGQRTAGGRLLISHLSLTSPGYMTVMRHGDDSRRRSTRRSSHPGARCTAGQCLGRETAG